MHKQEAEELAQRTGLALVSLYPSPVTPEARDRAIEALDQSLVVWNDGDDKLVRMYIRQALSALRGS
jgi:hypothetical protein